MIHESGRIVAIEEDSLWVETIQRSTCGSCAAEKGCGQGVLAKYSGSTTYIRVLLEGRNPGNYRLHDEINIGIPEDVIAKGSLLVYFTPLLGLIGGAALGAPLGEAYSIGGALLGLLTGGALVRIHAYLRRDDRRIQPIILDDVSAVQVVGS